MLISTSVQRHTELCVMAVGYRRFDAWRLTLDASCPDISLETHFSFFQRVVRARVRLSVSMELLVLWEQVPPLIDACVDDDKAVLKGLRLVNKDASRSALLGLRSYSVQLHGKVADTNICGSSLLSGTKLKTLELDLLISGEWVLFF